MSNNEFYPDWIETAPKEKSYRSIFKWGSPSEFKHPNNRLYAMMKKHFNLTDDHFKSRISDGNEEVKFRQKIKLSKSQVSALEKIVGSDNVSSDEYTRLKYSSGKTCEEQLRLRKGDIGKVSDLVLHPKNKDAVQKIVQYCNKQKIPVYVYGGGSSVNFGYYPTKGGVTIALNTHMNQIVSINEENQTVVVQAGMMGPAFEETLNNGPERFGTRRRYTCGHFPQSFEYSSVGGWAVTLGSGQQSSYYGDAYDLILSGTYITPAGTFTTLDYPATATGPKVNDIMKGSEGSFGILVELTWKIFRYMPENRQRFGFIFKTFEDTVNAAREIAQSEFGMPSVFRIQDQEETDVSFKLYGIEGTFVDTLLKLRGFKPMERCLFLGQADGEKNFTKNVKKQVKRICKKYGAMYITGLPVNKWEHGRFTDPYMREDLMDYGLMTDTLETTINWDNLHKVHQGVREFIKSRPGTICISHCSHMYPQGTNLYFIYIAKMDDVKEYKELQDGILDRIQLHGGSLSHHHGVGKMIGPWMDAHLGKEQVDVLRALKKHFDPNGIMNPGGQLGLDLAPKDVRKIKIKK